MGVRARLICLGVGAVIGLAAATQVVAWRYGYHPALGFGIPIGDGAKFYPPWDFLIWSKSWGQRPEHHVVMRMGVAVLMFGLMAGLLLMKLFDTPEGSSGGELGLAKKHPRARGWGDPEELVKAGLTKQQGVIFGRLDKESLLDRWARFTPELLTTPDMRPMLVTGGTRSGKGRGIVVPSLLNWDWSALIFDPKAELWTMTAGFRRCLGPALFFNPRSPFTARFNPLAEISPGRGAVGQVRQLVEILIEPGGANANHDFWDRQGADILCVLILHVLYTAELADKTLVTVRDLSADLDQAAAHMIATRHIINPKAGPDPDQPSHICHPYILQAAKAYMSAHEKGRKSVQMTVRSYLSWIAGSEVEHAISGSDFRIGDLMCNKEPVSLYVQVSPGDLKALQPLVRLFFHLTATAFTTHMETDCDGRPKENALLMALDEFPLLGKVSFFEDVVRLASGYGIKCLFVAQSLNDISRVYGPHNGFLDNAHIYVAFAALDPVTRDKVSKLTGHVTETRVSASLPHQFGGHGGSRTLAEVERPLLDLGEVGSLPDDKQLVFIAGHRPYLLPKLRYDKVGWMAKRSALPVHNQRERIDTPEQPGHPWAKVKAFGFDPQVEVVVSCENGGARHLKPGAPAPIVAQPIVPREPAPDTRSGHESHVVCNDQAAAAHNHDHRIDRNGQGHDRPGDKEPRQAHGPIKTDEPAMVEAEHIDVIGPARVHAAPRLAIMHSPSNSEAERADLEDTGAPSALETVRRLWESGAVQRAQPANGSTDQMAFDFDAPVPPKAASEPSPRAANDIIQDDLFDRLHRGEG